MPEVTRTEKTFLKVKEGKLYKVVNKEEIPMFAYRGRLSSINYFEKDVQYNNATIHIHAYEVVFYDEGGLWVWSADASSFMTLFFFNALLNLKAINKEFLFRAYLNKDKKTNIAVEEDLQLIAGDYKGTLVKGKYNEFPKREPVIVKGKQYEVKGVLQWNWEPIENFISNLAAEITERLQNEPKTNGTVSSNGKQHEPEVDDDNDTIINDVFGNAEKA